MKRRDFILGVGLSAANGFFHPRLSLARESAFQQTGNHILVLVELKGGNDGLNTVIPYTDQNYYTHRKGLAIQRDAAIQLTEDVALNPDMKSLMPLWKDKQLAIVQGAGYPDPNRSHFRSIEIWETASRSDEYLSAGWLSQPIQLIPMSERNFADGISVGQSSSGFSNGALSGTGVNTLAIRSPEQFIKGRLRASQVEKHTDNPALRHLLKVNDHLQQATQVFRSRYVKGSTFRTEFSNKNFSQDIKNVARLIEMGLKVPVFKVSHGGFDTHRQQAQKHNRLLKELSEGLSSFRSAMIELGLWDRVLVMTYSEFGRRVTPNGSGGTDHGTAAPQFFIGGKVKGGIYGKQPSLTDLDNGDLKFTTDFRRMYSTVIENWWHLPRLDFGKKIQAISCIS